MLPKILTGQTARYKGNGRQLGYPTANLDIDTDLADGVYFGFANLADYDHHPALIFIGTPTTVGDVERRVEAHLLDIADHDYYDELLKLHVVQFHRPNQTFSSIKELISTMHEDEKTARAWFLNRKRLHDK